MSTLYVVARESRDRQPPRFAVIEPQNQNKKIVLMKADALRGHARRRRVHTLRQKPKTGEIMRARVGLYGASILRSIRNHTTEDNIAKLPKLRLRR